MALTYVARSVVIPALHRASGPRLSPSAGSRALSSRYPQAGYSNGDASWRQSSEEITEVLARHKASCEAAEDAIMRARRMKKIEWRIYMGFAALGLGLGVYTHICVFREVRKIAMERAAAREEARERGTWV